MPTGSHDDGAAGLPAVSVVICAFTPERLEVLGQAISSLGAQTVPPHEILLVIDHAPEMLEESRARWPDIRVIPNHETQGASGGRNSGLSEATGDVVAFVDDDAIPVPDWLERLAGGYTDDRVLGVGGTVRPRWLEGRPGWFPAEFDWVVGCTHSGMPRERQAVRNLVGCNMSFRRDALIEIGAFPYELGRIGEIRTDGKGTGRPALSAEETGLCIRLSERWPDGLILYDPAVAVDHIVPPSRGGLRYFAARCATEGHSKAALTQMAGTRSGLSAERSYVSRTLPLGFVRGFRDLLRGDAMGASRAVMIAVGLMITTAAYLLARGLPWRPAARHSAPQS